MMATIISSVRNLALAAVALLLASCAPQSANGPNLLLICADTVRADFFFNPEINDAFSPWLQKARRYTNAVTPAPWTLPTIASVFTGFYPIQHGAGDLPGPVANLSEETPTALDPAAETLAEILAGQNFQTALFSAHPWLKEGFGLDQGFQHREHQSDDRKLIKKMGDWISGSGSDGQNFVYLHLMGAHDLHRKSRPELEEILASLDASTRGFLVKNAVSRACKRPDSTRCLRQQVYLLSVLQMRESLALVMQELQSTGLLDRTSIALFSDHGEAFQEHLPEQRRLAPDPRGTNGGGHGHYLYQEVLHVPLLTWNPGEEAGDHDGTVSLVDLFPSLLEWLAVPHHDNRLPGKILGEPSNSEPVFASNIAYGPQSIAIVAGKQKAIYWPGLDEFNIFDLATDPGEKDPLDKPGLILEFSTLAGDYLEMEKYYQAAAPELDESHLQDLQSIGYLQGEEEENP